MGRRFSGVISGSEEIEATVHGHHSYAQLRNIAILDYGARKVKDLVGNGSPFVGNFSN